LPGTWDTFLRPHLGHFAFDVTCSEIVSEVSNFFPHLSQRYWYVGMGDFPRLPFLVYMRKKGAVSWLAQLSPSHQGIACAFFTLLL
jgi:hypothetical protein